MNLAYQMLGDVGEAEDVAQEAFLRLARTEPAQIEDVRAWLTVVAGRLCLDQLRSASARHEHPDKSGALDTSRSSEPDPADRITLDDEVRTALLEVLRRLSPGERVAFVLHDVFQMPFEEIAEAVGRPVGTCRQLARRARSKFSDASPRASDVSRLEHQLVTDKFITACANGDLAALSAVLDPTVWGVATFLGDPAPPAQTNRGRERLDGICCDSWHAARWSPGWSASQWCSRSRTDASSRCSCSPCAMASSAKSKRPLTRRPVGRSSAGSGCHPTIHAGGIRTVSIM